MARLRIRISAMPPGRAAPFREFKGNVAHSNYDGFMFDREHHTSTMATFGVTGNAHIAQRKIPLIRPARRWQRTSRISPPTRTATAVSGPASEMHVFNNAEDGRQRHWIYARVRARPSGVTAFTSRVVDSLFVGETENIGNPRTDAEKAPRPQPAEADDAGLPDPRLRSTTTLPP